MTQMQLVAVGSLEPSQAPNRALAARDSERPGARRDRPGMSHEVPSERPFADHLEKAKSQRNRSSDPCSPGGKQRSPSEGPVSEEAGEARGRGKGKQRASGEASGDKVQPPVDLAPSELAPLADASTDPTALASPSEVEVAVADGWLLGGTGHGSSMAETGTESVGPAGTGQVGAAPEGDAGTIGSGQQLLVGIEDGGSQPNDGADAVEYTSGKAVASSELADASQDKGGIKEPVERGSGQSGNWQMQGPEVRAAEAKANPEQRDNGGQHKHSGAGDAQGTALTSTSGEGSYQAVTANAASGIPGANPARISREGQAQATDETGQGSIILENEGATSEIEMVGEGGAGTVRGKEPKGSSVPEGINDDIEKAMAGASPNHEVTEATRLTNRSQPIASNQAFDVQSTTAKGTGELAADPQPPALAEMTIEPQDVMKEVVTRTRMIRNGESSAMVVRLKPEHLGEVRVEIRVTGNQVSAHFATPSRDVQDVLMQNIQQLRTAFAGRDLDLTSIDVSMGNDGEQESGGNHASQTQSQDQNSRGHGQRPGRGQAESGWVLPQGWQQAVGANTATAASLFSRQSPYGPGSGMVNYRV